MKPYMVGAAVALLALWVGLESGYRIGTAAEYQRNRRAVMEMTGNVVRLMHSVRQTTEKDAYARGWTACMEQF